VASASCIDAQHPSLRGVVAVLLDYGGTLDGDARHWFDHFHEVYGRAGVTVDRESFKRAFYAADAALEADPAIRSFGLTRMLRAHVDLQLAHLGMADAKLARHLAGTFESDTRRAWDRNRPLLRRLAARYRLGVVSNSYGNMPALIAEADLAPFEIVLDSAIEGIRKPDPALYALAARRLALEPAAILHVGDSWERDVAAARAAGLRAAWLALPEAAMPADPPAVWRLASLLDLEGLLS
jgi:putative hydrolase of the HAD superfamily